MTVQNYWFKQGLGIVKNSSLVNLLSRTILGAKLAAILDFDPLGDHETIFEYFHHILHPQKHIFRCKVCGFVRIRSSGMEYPIFSFSYFLWWPFWKCSRRGSASQKFSVNIIDSYFVGCKLIEKYKFVDLWEGEGCMIGMSRLQPTKLCIQRYPDIILTQITTPATQFWYRMKAQN